jgi:hypothetical protein
MGTDNGILNGTPTNDDVGRWWVNVSVSDGVRSDFRNFSLAVLNTNDPPTTRTDLFKVVMDEDTVLDLDLNTAFIDIDKDKLTYSVKPQGNLSLTVQNNILRIAPFKNWAGTETIRVSAKDGSVGINGSISITVNNVNDPPSDLSVNRSETYRQGREQMVSASASDPDLIYGDALLFTWECNGEIIGQGPSIDLRLPKGVHTVNVTVADTEGTNVSKEFRVGVLSNNDRKQLPLFAIISAILRVFVILIVFLIIRTGRKGIDPQPDTIPIPFESDLQDTIDPGPPGPEVEAENNGPMEGQATAEQILDMENAQVPVRSIDTSVNGHIADTPQIEDKGPVTDEHPFK